MPVLSGDFGDLLAGDTVLATVKAYVETNIDTAGLTDKTLKVIRLGKRYPVSPDAAGKWTITLPSTAAADLGLVAGTLRYQVVATFSDPVSGPDVWRSGWFELTAAGDVADLATSTTAAAAAWTDTFRVEMEALKAETEAARDAAVATSAADRDRANHTGTQPASTVTGLGDAATKNVGTTAGTVAAGDDARFGAGGGGAVTTTAKADAKTVSDAAMAAGSAVVTSTTATFAAADVGKLAVAENALGAGVHLYTTIASFQSPTQVTLSASATTAVSATDLTYGTDDTTAIQSAITTAETAGKVLLLPPTPCCISAPLVVGKPVSIVGVGVQALNGQNTSGASTEAQAVANGDILPMAIPVTAPYLSGSGLVQMAPDVDAITATGVAGSLNLRDFGIRFAGAFKRTGHGVRVTGTPMTSPSSGVNSGLINAKWDNLYVYGHGPNKYAWYATNTLYWQFTHGSCWGGGGLQIEADSSVGFYGNAVLSNIYAGFVDPGSAHGFHMLSTRGMLGLLTFVRPQTITVSVYSGTRLAKYGANTAGTAYGVYATGYVGEATFVAPDIEGKGWHSSTLNVANIIGSTSYGPAGFYDGKKFVRMAGERQLNNDGSITLNNAEAAGGVLDLLYDRARGLRWGLTTDGTLQSLQPGTVRHTGSSPSAASGAALGTSPPPVLVKGADSAGRATFGSGTTPAPGSVATFTFARPLATGALVRLEANNAATQALGLYVTGLTTTGFTVACATAPAASQGVSTYDFSWFAVDGQGAPVVPYVYESFDKADSLTTIGSPQIGPAPVANNASVWGITANQGRLVTDGGGNGQNTLTWDAGFADCTITCTLVVVDGGLSFRNNGTAFLYATASQCWHFNGSSWAQVGSNFSQTFANGDTMKIILAGSSITIQRNGTQVFTATSTVNQTVTKHGLYANNTGTTARFDNYRITPN